MLSQVPTELVVTGRALEASRAEEPLAVKLIDRDELRASGANGLEQVLQQVPGLQLFRRSDARSANPTSQGVTLRALGGNASSRALLVLDGVPQTDPFGGWVNWPAYDPLALGKVLVTRGGGSVTNGPGALAGTIELSSDSSEEALADASLGSRQSSEARLVANERLGPGLLGLSAHASRSDGFTPVTANTRGPADKRAPYRNATARLRWSRPLVGNAELQTAVSGFADKRSRGLEFSDNRTQGGDAFVRVVGRGSWQWSVLAYAQFREFESSFAATDDERTTARRTSLQYHVPGRAVGWSAEMRPSIGPALELRLGTDGRLMRGRSEELGSYVNGVATRDRSSGGEVGHAGSYAEASWTADKLLLTAGVRVDRLHISDGFFRDRIIATGMLAQDVRYGDRTDWLATARGGARLSIGSGAALRGAAYMGWRPPTLNELFRPFRLGIDATAANAELKPERSKGFEAGIEWQQNGFSVELTAYRDRLADAIANVTIGSGPGFFKQVGFIPAGGVFRQRQNVSAIEVTGIEAGASWSRGPWFLATDTSWARARIRDSAAAVDLFGLRPAQTPSFTASASASWRGKLAELSMQLRYMGPQYEDDLNRIHLPGTFTATALARVPITKQLQLIGRAENLFNADIIAARTTDGTSERATPRTLWLGLRLMQVVER